MGMRTRIAVACVALLLSELACDSDDNNNSTGSVAPDASGVEEAGELTDAEDGGDAEGEADAAEAAPASVTINIPPNAMALGTAAFGQNPLVIPVGTAVTWVNTDSIVHTTTSDDSPPTWDSNLLSSGQSFTFTFTSAGTFPYHCNVHPVMKGTIQVE